jgi:hypothetical protein
MQLSALIFREQFKRFQEAVRLNSEEEFHSFREGLPKEWEGYKDDVYTWGQAWRHCIMLDLLRKQGLALWLEPYRLLSERR